MFEDVSSFVNGFMKNFDFPYVLLMKYNPIGRNRGLCSLEKSCGYSLELLFVEPNILVVSQRQICDIPLATIVWEQILSKKTILCLQVIYFLFVFCANLVFSLLLCVIFTTVATVSVFLSCSSHLFGYHKKNLQFLPKNSG